MANTKITELSLATSFNDTDLVPIVVDPSGSPITKKATIATFKVYAKGDTGATGAAGTNGTNGTNGVGVPTGGTIHQALTKVDSDNYDTQWETIDKTFVGLGNVDNTSDATKNSATATLTNKTIIQKVTAYTPVGAGTTTIDLTTGNIHTVTMPADTQTIAISNEAVGQCFLIEINNVTSQGALTWFTTIRWAGGSAPTLTGTNGKRDVFGFRVTGTDTYDGYVVGQNI